MLVVASRGEFECGRHKLEELGVGDVGGRRCSVAAEAARDWTAASGSSSDWMVNDDSAPPSQSTATTAAEAAPPVSLSCSVSVLSPSVRKLAP